MKSSLLPETLDFSNCLTYEEQEKIAYDYFCEHIKPLDKREKFRGKNIKINLTSQYLDSKEESFLHLTGFDETNKYSLNPCNNLEIETQCFDLCNVEGVPNNQRIFCLYRARLLPWFNEIIKLANNDSPYIIYWEKEKVHPKSNKKDKIACIRFKEDIADFLIILRIYPDGNYQLMSAYPLVLKKLRKNCEEEYKKYINTR